MANIYYESDVNKEILKDRTVAVIGFGNQGHAHGMNLKDSGARVIVGLRDGSPRREAAEKYGLKVFPIADAVKRADIIMILIPDELQGEVFDREISPYLSQGKTLLFAHGFTVLYQLVKPPECVDVAMVAPKGQGHMLRREYVAGRGIPGVLAIHQDVSGQAGSLALAYAHGIGLTRVGVIESTFREETEADLFSEQAVICGGVSQLMKAGFETLVEAGYQPEMAYFECVNEMKLIVDLVYEKGLSFMREAISNTAEYGDYRSQGNVIGPESREKMGEILKHIRSGEFARDFMRENHDGKPFMREMREKEGEHPLEKTFRELSKKMPWIPE
jgi:ketol-acid reductoisomerase